MAKKTPLKTSQVIVRMTEETNLKFKYVAWERRQTLSIILADHIDAIIADFEKEHGPITGEQLKEARIK